MVEFLLLGSAITREIIQPSIKYEFLVQLLTIYETFKLE